jgi:hypothetical protein
MITLQELSNVELDNLQLFGHLGNKTRTIAELRHFYNAVEEEIKRRNLKERNDSNS